MVVRQLAVSISDHDVSRSRAKPTSKGKQIFQYGVQQLGVSRLQVDDSENKNDDSDQKVGKLKNSIALAQIMRTGLLLSYLIKQFVDVIVI